MIKEYLNEYIDIWKSFFDADSVTEKKYFILFVSINFLCLLAIFKMSEFSEMQSFINGITIFLFVITLIVTAKKSGIPTITSAIFFKIVLVGALVGIVNILMIPANNPDLGYAILVIVPICCILYPVFVIITILFVNFFKKEKITDIELCIYFMILVIITVALTQINLPETTR